MDPRRLITIIVVGGLALAAVAIILFKIMQEAKRRNMENNYKLPSLEKEEEEEETKFNVVFDDSKLSFKTDDEKELQKALTERSEVKGLSIDDMFEEVEENYKKKQKVYLPTLELEESIEESAEETREERRAEIEEIIEGKDDGFSELLADLDLDGE